MTETKIKLQNYVLNQPMNIYGMFFPIGTIYKQVNADWWHPIVNGAQLPSYAVHFMVIKNNGTYFSKTNT